MLHLAYHTLWWNLIQVSLQMSRSDCRTWSCRNFARNSWHVDCRDTNLVRPKTATVYQHWARPQRPHQPAKLKPSCDPQQTWLPPRLTSKWCHSTGLLAAISCGRVCWGRSASQSIASNVSAIVIGRKKSREYSHVAQISYCESTGMTHCVVGSLGNSRVSCYRLAGNLMLHQSTGVWLLDEKCVLCLYRKYSMSVVLSTFWPSNWGLYQHWLPVSDLVSKLSHTWLSWQLPSSRLTFPVFLIHIVSLITFCVVFWWCVTCCLYAITNCRRNQL